MGFNENVIQITRDSDGYIVKIEEKKSGGEIISTTSINYNDNHDITSILDTLVSGKRVTTTFDFDTNGLLTKIIKNI